MYKTINTKNFSETQEVGKKLADQADGLQVIALHGDLGAGKTTFVQGFAKALGIDRNITSPTFIIMRSYQIHRQTGKPKVYPESHKKNGSRTSQDDDFSKKYLYHVDLYRAESISDVEGLGLLELMNDPDNIVLIEWPEKIEKYLPKKTKHIYFKYLEDDKREIMIV